MSGSVIKYAQRYAQLGLPVFPVNGKVPLTPHGFKDATTDPATIDAWWQRWPDAGVAAPTGLLFDVVDVDSIDALHALEALVGADLFPEHLGIARTPRGWHFLIPTTGDGNGTGVIVPGVDYRGQGGYVVLPPSTRPEGAYEWMELPTFGNPDAGRQQLLEATA